MKSFGKNFIFLVTILIFIVSYSFGGLKQSFPVTHQQFPGKGSISYSKIDSAHRNIVLNKEYVDVLYLGITKNCYVDIKGTLLLSADVGGDKRNVMIAVQENSNILKLKALKKGFPEANMIIVTQDTVLQYLIRYSDTPLKNYYAYDIKLMREENIAAMVTKQFEPDSGDKLTPATKLGNFIDSTHISNILKPLSKEEDTIRTLVQLDIGKSASDSSSKLRVETGQENNQELAREEINFERLRAKKVNILTGDLSGGVEGELNRLYTNAQKNEFYYAISLYNREGTDYTIAGIQFVIQNKGTYQGRSIILKYRQASRNIKLISAGGIGALIFSTGRSEMMPEEALVITIQLVERAGELKKTLRIKLNSADMSRASKWN